MKVFRGRESKKISHRKIVTGKLLDLLEQRAWRLFGTRDMLHQLSRVPAEILL